MSYTPNVVAPGVPTILQLAQEGRWVGSTGGVPTGFSTATHPTVTAGVAVFVNSLTVPIGRAYVVVSLNAGIDGLGEVLYSFAPSSRTNAYQSNSYSGYSLFGTTGGTAQWNFQGGFTIPELGVLRLGSVATTTTGNFCGGSS